MLIPGSLGALEWKAMLRFETVGVTPVLEVERSTRMHGRVLLGLMVWVVLGDRKVLTPLAPLEHDVEVE